MLKVVPLVAGLMLAATTANAESKLKEIRYCDHKEVYMRVFLRFDVLANPVEGDDPEATFEQALSSQDWQSQCKLLSEVPVDVDFIYGFLIDVNSDGAHDQEVIVWRQWLEDEEDEALALIFEWRQVVVRVSPEDDT